MLGIKQEALAFGVGDDWNRFNPLDKWAEEITENRKLYERLLQAEKGKTELLQKLLDKHK